MSTDNTRAIAESYGAKIVVNEKQTVAPGRNVGFIEARGDLIAFSDADCVMDINWLKNSVKYFENNGKLYGYTAYTFYDALQLVKHTQPLQEKLK